MIVNLLVGLKYFSKPTGRIRTILLRNARGVVVPGAVALDIGVNGGLFSIVAALSGTTGKVVAFGLDGWLARPLTSKKCSVGTIHRKSNIVLADDAIMWIFM
jgi:hypothetical protein